MSDGVAIGTAIVSYIEPHEGQAHAFNRWYERDHFPAAVTAGPGVFADGRFVATHACKKVRPDGALFGDPARGSYLSLAWLLPDTQPAWDAFVIETMPRLRAEDRMFAGRDHIHTAIYAPSWAVGLPAPMALDHGFAGVLAIAGHEPTLHEWARASSNEHLPTIIGLAPVRAILSTAEPAEHHLVLAFRAGDPIEAWIRAATDLRAAGFASPFLRTIPGTDAYVDEL